jgi:acyl-CoA reductase-like NAD-dependent aldehyde dehydrogenase
LYVQESIYDKFCAALVKKVETINIADPFDASHATASA